MLQRAVQKLRCALALWLWTFRPRSGQALRWTRKFPGLSVVVVLLLAAACSNLEPSISPQPTNTVARETVGAEHTPDNVLLTGHSVPPRTNLGRRVKFEHISLEQGLSQSTVHAIFQDSRGFMWFGTNDGLNKYDGYSFTIYRHNPEDPHSLSDNTVVAIFEDRSGALWIGTDGGGLNKLDRDEEQFVRYQNDPGDPNSLSDDRVSSVYEDRSGVLWIGTGGGGLNRFDRDREQFVHDLIAPDGSDSPGSNAITTICEDQLGDIWVGTDGGGLYRRGRGEEQFVRYQNDPDDPHSLSDDQILSIYEDYLGVLWIGTHGSGLDRFDRYKGQFTNYRNDPDDPHSLSHNIVKSVYGDQVGVLWVGTAGGGLNRFDRNKRQFIPYRSDSNDLYSLSSDVVESIYEDRSGVLWIGTYGGGINKFDRGQEQFAHYQADPTNPNSLNESMVWAIHEDQAGVLWIGTGGGGLNRFDRGEGQFIHYQNESDDPNSLSNNLVTSICEDRTGVLWVGTGGGGLNRLDRQERQFIRYQSDPYDPYSLNNDTVMSIYEDRSGMLWIGTYGGGLNRFDREKGQFVHYRSAPDDPHGLSCDIVRSIYEDQAGVLWVGTWGGGLNRFDREEERFTRYSNDPDDPHSLSNDLVTSIYEDESGALWIGTWGGGLNRFDREKGQFTHYRYGEKGGLPNDVVYGVLEDRQGYLWLSTNSGLSRFDPRTETFKNYDVGDGLQSNEFNGGAYHKSRSGEMFFGGVNGFNAFYPGDIKDNPYVPPVVLTSLTQGGEGVGLGRAVESVAEVTFRWPNNFFEFEFAALSYSQPEKNQYAYMLEGLEEDWIPVGTRRFGRYTNLSGGTYTLRIKGSNNQGVWSEEGVSVEITIVPPFWETLWFRGGAILVLAVSVIGGYRLRVRSVEARSRELETRIEQRTAELRQEIDQRVQIEEALRQSEMEKAVAAERSRLARDLHDAVTQTLFSASLIAEALLTSWEKDQEEGRQLLRELRRLTRGALAEMRTLLLELRPAALVEANLGDLLRQLAEAATGREGVTIVVTVEGERDLLPDVHIALYRIAQEALNNVVKHARADQVTVSLRCFTSGGAVELCISDDGRGFDPDCVPPDRLGLGIMRERAQAVGATLTVESQPGAGTKVTAVWQDGEGREGNGE